jgi:hypothetical protein
VRGSFRSCPFLACRLGRPPASASRTLLVPPPPASPPAPTLRSGTLVVTVRRKSTWYWKFVGGWKSKPSRRSLSVESNPRQATPATPQAKPSEKRQPTLPLTTSSPYHESIIFSEQPKSQNKLPPLIARRNVHLVIVNQKKAAMILSCVFCRVLVVGFFFFFLSPFPSRMCES